MLLQKTLHMSQSLDECKSRLASIHSYRRHLMMVTKATMTSSKTIDFGFRGPLGFKAQTVIAVLESEAPEQFEVDGTAAVALLNESIDAAKGAGLVWEERQSR